MTVQGTGANITFSTPAVNCSASRAAIRADVSIAGGFGGNAITAVASCTQGGAAATATVTDPGTGQAVNGSGTGGSGAGAASCGTTYMSAGAPDSAWTALCRF